MEIGAFYTEGSNRIKVELYAEGSSDVVINLLNSNVSDSKLSILDTDDTRTREQKLSKFIDRSIVVEKHNFNDGQATIYFNFLDFDVSSYMVEAISGNEEKSISSALSQHPYNLVKYFSPMRSLTYSRTKYLSANLGHSEVSP